MRCLLKIRTAIAQWVLAMLLLVGTAAQATELVMVEHAGCEWCARWNHEIAPAYPNTSEGQFAPLRRVDLRALPQDLVTVRRVTFTPTFLIVDDNAKSPGSKAIRAKISFGRS